MAKSKYESHVKDKLTLITAWCRNGLTDKQIANNLGISEDSFYKYKKENIEFSEALKKGKEVIDFEVENALLKRAMGYKTKEVKKEVDSEGNEKVTTTYKDVAADTTAQIFWLKNRKPSEWRDKKEIESNTTVTGSLDLTKYSTEELKTMINKYR